MTFATIPGVDIEGCNRLPVSRYSGDSNKRVNKKFVNRKHPEALLRNKKTISSKDFSHLNVHGKVFVFVSLCPYYRYIWGRYIWGKCKDMQRRGKTYQVFCLGGTIAVKVTERSSGRNIYFMNAMYLILILMMCDRVRLNGS